MSTAATFCATVVDEWIRHGLTDAVVAPGSRSTPLALALVARSELAVHVILDERSASFAALGLALASGRPALLLCTSGTAATHFHGAVAEADLAGVPMIVCTADRPPELRDVGAPQTIDQNRLYGPAVRWFCDPGVADEVSRSSWRTLARRAWHASTAQWPGPVHVNLPFREPLVGTPAQLPAANALDVTTDVATSVMMDDLSTERGVIIAGFGAAPYAAEILATADRLGWPVLADPRSGCRHTHGAVVTAADALLRHDRFAADHRPSVVIRVGQPPASKVLNQWVAASGARLVQLGGGTWTDPEHQAAVVLPIDATAAVLQAIPTANKTPWAVRWLHAEARAQQVFDDRLAGPDLDGPTIARVVTAAVAERSALVVSSSMPIRDVEWFGVNRSDLTVVANRGANGIDGVTSTALGVALSGQTTTLLIGDLAFLHDQGALIGLARRAVDLTIVVVDNNGGGIFEFLPQATAVDRPTFEQLWGTPHGADLVALARAHGLNASEAETVEGLRELLGTSGVSIVVVRTDRTVTVARQGAVNAAVVAALDAR
jgi:2-succinyl-5-enolpyruvyl-6-hydroxy-3-cyclohexene-1-carboxylate synthase